MWRVWRRVVMRSMHPASGVALMLSVGLAGWMLGPVLTQPDAWLVGNWMHPDCLSNHWLLAWVADRLLDGESIWSNTDYYWPVGDAPVLAGNGGEGLVYAVFHAMWGWPAAVPKYLFVVLTASGLAGYFLGRSCGAGRWGSLVPCVMAVASPFVATELGAGRFSQANTAPLLLFCALWMEFLRRPSPGRAVMSALVLATAAGLYWYFGFFGVLFGACVLLARWRHRPPLGLLVLFSVVFFALVTPLLAVFVLHWQDIPGTDELSTFPPAGALLDSAQLDWPWRIEAGRAAGAALPLSVCVLAVLGVVSIARGRMSQGGEPHSADKAVVLVTALFVLLSLGPAAEWAPYTLIYGLAEPLRRFWWPLRHMAVAGPMIGVLAGIGLTMLAAVLRDTRWGGGPRVCVPLCILFAVSVPVQLAVQGVSVQVPLTPIQLPPPAYPKLAAMPDGVLFEPPLIPELGGTQLHLIYQRWHHKPLLTGHAPWVDRVRPPSWDDFVGSNSFLAGLQRMERGELDGRPLVFSAGALEALRSRGLAYVSLNRAALPLQAKPLVQAYEEVFSTLFGEPISRGRGIKIWSTEGWDGRTSVVPVSDWRWPDGLMRAGPEAPLVARRPRSQVFERE